MQNRATKGMERERTVANEEYISDAYFALPQLFSMALQIHHIHKLKPASIIEIGPGNGFTSTFLRRAGYPVTTVDINPALKPDICAPLCDLHLYIKEPVDLVVCCEVLEHIGFEEFEANLDALAQAGRRLFLTLPNVYTTAGMGVLLRVPAVGRKLIDLNFNLPRRHKLEGTAHFWEVGYRPECSRNAILASLRKRYSHVETGRFAMNPYHIYFIAS